MNEQNESLYTNDALHESLMKRDDDLYSSLEDETFQCIIGYEYYGFGIGRFLDNVAIIEATPVSVEFDAQRVLKREETKGDIVGFYHTHPHQFGVSPSDRDIRTMAGWVSCFGKPLLCVIASRSEYRVWVFHSKENWYEIPAILARNTLFWRRR